MQTISWLSLSWCLIPIIMTMGIYIHWQLNAKELMIACARMFIQLITIGYVLIFMFSEPSPIFTLAIMTLMICAASWIAIRPVRQHKGYFKPAIIALAIAVLLHLFISVQLILEVQHWYLPKIIVPLAGMYFANTMNTISLASERFQSNIEQNMPVNEARKSAFQSAMIPQINSLLAVGLVSLPGMMTGQILSDVSPAIAVRYQVMIMTMMLGSNALGAAIMLWQLERKARPKSLS
ncbi:MAG: ABC transporter permease [Oceanospirillaceae bacterium]|nr:ABC transporter permease [Oceanospirillaceae bacterium]